MSLIIAILVSALFLDWPWNVVVVIGAAAWEALEIMIFLRWRKRKPISGPDGLIGARGTAVTSCKPEGQARIAGRFWSVNCGEGAEPGDAVIVVEVNGNRLLVERAAGLGSG